MELRTFNSIKDISHSDWDNLVRHDYPFMRYAFLSALEDHQCIGEKLGWIPHYLTTYDQGKLTGALPIFEKHNSWGEFVFDHAWADAWQRAGMHYYPKLVNAIPFTPATGPRLLVDPLYSTQSIPALRNAANELVVQLEASGIHSLFPDEDDFNRIQNGEWLERNDCQFHWQNNHYRDFSDFLSQLKAKKRKNILQERRKVRDAGIEIQVLNGHTASPEDWLVFTQLYNLIYDRKWGMPAFNVGFFLALANAIPDNIVLVLAKRQENVVAGAMMYHDNSTLYGRHWGCKEYIDSLHFEVCYYQGIEFSIQNALTKFDPGAQGEHKLARGFLPTKTRSLHKMVQSPFDEALKDFVTRESMNVNSYIDALLAHSPYTQNTE